MVKAQSIGPLPSTASLIEKPAHAYGLAALSGFLYFLSFPGMDLWPLTFVALVPLMIALRGQAPKRALKLGWLAGFVITMTGFYWLLGMLKVFSGFPLPLCLIFMVLLCGYQAGRLGLLGWLTARGEQRGWRFGVVFSLAFAASELVYPLLFPWHYGATVHQVPALIQVAELGNPIAVAMVLIAVNLGLAELVCAKLRGRLPNWRLIAALFSVPAWACLYGFIRIRQVDANAAAAPKARVGIVQANMSLLGKRKERQEGLLRHLRLTRQLREQGPLDLAVWSETSVMSSVDEARAAVTYPRRFTSKIGVPTIFGGVLVRPVSDSREYVLFNSALASDATGKITGRYDKQFLLAFGEYLPFGEAFPVLYDWSPQSGKFTPGQSFEPLKIAGHEVAVFICYEDIIPNFVNRIVRNGNPDLLVNMTNDAWFGDTTEPWIHLALAQFRAVEHRRYLVRSTNSGVSAFIDPVGRVISHGATFKEQALAAEVAWMKANTPYEIYGDIPWWLASALALAMAFVRRPAGKPGILAATDV